MLCTSLEPLHDRDPDDDEHGSQKAWDARRLHGDAEQAEMVYRYGGYDLSGQEQADRRRGAEAGCEDDRGAHEESSEQTPEPHPPGRAHNGPELGHRAAHDRCSSEQDYRPDQERERRSQNRPADDLA